MLQVNDALQIYQMRREIAILRKVSYDRNIVQFYGACTSEPTMLCMEYMEVRGARLAASSAGTHMFVTCHNGMDALMQPLCTALTVTYAV